MSANLQQQLTVFRQMRERYARLRCQAYRSAMLHKLGCMEAMARRKHEQNAIFFPTTSEQKNDNQ